MRAYLIIFISLFFLIGCSTPKPVEEIKTSTEKKRTAEVHNIPGTSITFEMMPLDGGTFIMGSPMEEASRNEDEGPQFETSVEPFLIGVHEVSYDEYNIYRQKELDLVTPEKPDWDADAIARPSPPYEDPTFGMGNEGFPAVSMTQFGALQYCKWLSQKSGRFYRLPTEAEWEYACRAGSSDPYYFGRDDAELDAHSWNYNNSAEAYHKIGTKEPNQWGLHDMLGNVSEWTLDQYKKDAYNTMSTSMADQVNPWIQPTKLHPRTVRGGSWDDKPKYHRCACRIRSSSRWKERDPQIPKSFWWNTDSPFVGFRIISPINQPSAEEQAAFWEMVLGG